MNSILYRHIQQTKFYDWLIYYCYDCDMCKKFTARVARGSIARIRATTGCRRQRQLFMTQVPQAARAP